jgi:hypothetical protein
VEGSGRQWSISQKKLVSFFCVSRKKKMFQTVIDHGKEPYQKFIVELKHNLSDLELEDLFDELHDQRLNIVSCKQNGHPLCGTSKIDVQFPVDITILHTWTQAVSFLLKKPTNDDFPTCSWFNGTAEIQSSSSWWTSEKREPSHAMFLNLPACCPQFTFVWRRHPEIGKIDYRSTEYTGIRGAPLPYMQQLVLGQNPLQPLVLDHMERKIALQQLMEFLWLFPQPLVSIVFDYSQSFYGELAETCQALMDHSVHIFVGENSVLLRQTNLLFKCASCEARETSSKRFQRCSGCKRRKYCSKECQKRHWSESHKRECSSLS